MATCPKCRGTVPYLKLMRHTKWTPIICPHCDARLHFDNRDWSKRAGTFVLLLLFLCVICLIGTWKRPSMAYVFVMAILGPALLVKFLLDVKKIKLRERGQ
jgi:CXXC-20-CXXC protein